MEFLLPNVFTRRGGSTSKDAWHIAELEEPLPRKQCVVGLPEQLSFSLTALCVLVTLLCLSCDVHMVGCEDSNSA